MNIRKTLLSLVAVGAVSSASALTNMQAFQQFDDQFNWGYGYYSANLKNGAGQKTLQNSQYLQLQAERLFDSGIWVQGTMQQVIATNSLGNSAIGVGQGLNVVSQDPNLFGMNTKVGYAFTAIDCHLLITPYVTLGINSNANASTVIDNFAANISKDQYYTFGLGGRVEYRINKWLDLYADLLLDHNWDKSGPLGGIMPQNVVNEVGLLGVKFNFSVFQVAANIDYTHFDWMSSAPTDLLTSTGVYRPTGYFGGNLTFGFHY